MNIDKIRRYAAIRAEDVDGYFDSEAQAFRFAENKIEEFGENFIVVRVIEVLVKVPEIKRVKI